MKRDEVKTCRVNQCSHPQTQTQMLLMLFVTWSDNSLVSVEDFHLVEASDLDFLKRLDSGVRCIVSGDQEDGIYAKDTVQVLKCLDIQHPAGLYVVQACLGHKDLHGCGVKSLIFLTGQLLSQVDTLIKQGVPLPYIADLLNEALDCCLQHVEKEAAVPVILSHSDHSKGSTSLLPSLLSSSLSTSQSYPQESLPAAKLEPPYPNTESVAQHLKLNRSDLSAEETAPDILAADDADLFRTKDDRVRRNLNCQASLSRSYKSMVKASEGPVSSVDLPGLSDVLRHRLKPASSASMRRNVMLRSRHLQGCSSPDEEKNCKASEPSQNCGFSVTGQERADRPCRVEDASLYPDLKASPSRISNTEDCRCSNCGEFVSSTQESGRPNRRLAAKKASVYLPGDALSLSHGCHEMMPWAQEAMRQHLLHGKRFDTGLLHTVCAQGHEGRHQLIDGLIISATSDALEGISKISGPTSVLLMNGDLTAEFKHQGYKAALPSVRLTEQGVGSLPHSSPDSWVYQAVSHLKQLAVRVVLVRGAVDPDLCMACMAAGVVLVDRVPFPALKVLQSACRVDFVTYILDAHEGNLCRGVSLKPLEEGWCDSVHLDRKHLVITPPVLVQTMVIAGSSAAGREVREEEWWHCTARLSQAARDGRLLQGGGGTEELCARLLTATGHQDQPDGDRGRGRWAGERGLYRPLVRAALADAFLSFARAVQHNRQKAGYAPQNSGPQGVRTAHPAQLSIHHLSSRLGQAASLNFSTNPNHPSCQETCEKSVGTNSCKSPSAKEKWCSNPSPSNPCACRKQDSEETVYRPPPKSVLQDMGTKPDLEDTCNAFKREEECCGCSEHSTCVSSLKGDAREEKLQDSLCAVCRNTMAERDFEEMEVWDNYSSKVNGWRAAVQCVCTVMRMDEVIITGVDQHSLPPHSVLL